MASELIVQTLKGPTSGANANKVIIPSGQTLDVSSGTFTKAIETGEVLQVVTHTHNGAYSGSNSGTGGTIGYGTGITYTTFSFTPKSASSTLLFQSSVMQAYETTNSGDGFFAALTDGTSTVYATVVGTLGYEVWDGNLNAVSLNFNHAFNSWGTSTKTLHINVGPLDTSTIPWYFNRDSYNTIFVDGTQRVIGFSMMEIAG